MPIEHPKEADLRPLHTRRQLLIPWLQNVQDDADTVFIVVADDTLIRISGIRLDVAAFLLTCFRGLMVFQVDRLGVQVGRISKQ
jgi:hypothetical protein